MEIRPDPFRGPRIALDFVHPFSHRPPGIPIPWLKSFQLCYHWVSGGHSGDQKSSLKDYW